MDRKAPTDLQHQHDPSPSLAAPRPRHLQLLSSSDDLQNDLTDRLPSPPYQRFPSSAHLLDSYQEQSPAYRSRSNLDLAQHMPDDKRDFDHDNHPFDDKMPSAKPTVHYPDHVNSPPITSNRPHTFARFDSDFTSGSRSPSIAGTDDELDEEDYDWSGEEDLVDEEAKFEHQMGVKRERHGCFRRFIGVLFGSLIGTTFLAGVFVTPAILIHFFWYKKNPSDHRRYVKDNVQAWLFWAAANIMISWWLALIVDIIPTVVRYLISMTWGHVSESIKGKLDLYNSVKDTVKPVFYAASGWVSWVILFEHIYRLYNPDDPDHSWAAYTPRVYDTVQFLFFLALVICAQRMLSHAIAFAFHRTAYRERLEEVENALGIIEKLRNYRPKRSHAPKSSFAFGRSTPMLSALSGGERTPRHTPTHSRSNTPDLLGRNLQSGDEADNEDPDATLVKKRKGKQRLSWINVGNLEDGAASEPNTVKHTYPPSAENSPNRTGHNTPKKDGDDDTGAALQEAATQAAKVLKAAVLHDARNIQGNDDDNLGGLVWNVTSAHEAKRLARAIYIAFSTRRRLYLIPSDFYPAFKTHEEAENAFRLFDKDNNGDISKAEVKTTLMKVYKERRFLSRSMRDVGVALSTLDNMLVFAALVILFFISLSVFNVSIGDSLSSVYTLGLAASFIFKNSASNMFDSIMFLFVTHPFDTGDRCMIDDENLRVKKMGLFATVFERVDGTETYYFNSMLFTKFIINFRRSDKTAENLTMQVAWRTPLEKLDELEKALNEWLSTDRRFQPSTGVTLQHIVYQRHLEITIGIPHNGNWQDWTLRMQRKTAFHAAVNYFCRQLGIIALEAPLPLTLVDPDGLELFPPSAATPYDEDPDEPYLASPAEEAHYPMRPPDGSKPVTADGSKVTTWLGFTPPSDKPISGVRARKSKSRKAMLRTMGADG